MHLRVAIVTLLCACTVAEKPILSWDEYARRTVTWPYVLVLETDGGGQLFYFGARHTYDPADPQIAQIEDAWESFRPDIAFTEGGHPPFESSRDEAVRKTGEPGLVRFLAARDDVPTTTLDPSLAEEVATLSGRFPRQQVKLFFVLRAVSQFVGRNGTAEVDREADRVLQIYARTPGLSGSPRSVDELRVAYAAAFPGQGAYADVPPSSFDPTQRDGALNAIARASSDYRDRYVVQRLAGHVRAGRRVFAVMGGSHVVMQEPALRSRLRGR